MVLHQARGRAGVGVSRQESGQHVSGPTMSDDEQDPYRNYYTYDLSTQRTSSLLGMGAPECPVCAIARFRRCLPRPCAQYLVPPSPSLYSICNTRERAARAPPLFLFFSFFLSPMQQRGRARSAVPSAPKTKTLPRKGEVPPRIRAWGVVQTSLPC